MVLMDCSGSATIHSKIEEITPSFQLDILRFCRIVVSERKLRLSAKSRHATKSGSTGTPKIGSKSCLKWVGQNIILESTINPMKSFCAKNQARIVGYKCVQQIFRFQESVHLIQNFDFLGPTVVPILFFGK